MVLFSNHRSISFFINSEPFSRWANLLNFFLRYRYAIFILEPISFYWAFRTVPERIPYSILNFSLIVRLWSEYWKIVHFGLLMEQWAMSISIVTSNAVILPKCSIFVQLVGLFTKTRLTFIVGILLSFPFLLTRPPEALFGYFLAYHV